MKKVLGLMLLIVSAIMMNSCSTDKTGSVTVSFVGDVLLDRGVGEKIDQNGMNYPVEGISSILNKTDISFGNLECPITSRGYPILKKGNIIFRAKTAAAEGLKEAGFTIINLANNHVMDYGRDGLTDTIKYLNQVGIKTVGAGINGTDARKPVYINKSGMTIGFLGYSAFPTEGYFFFEDRPDVAQVVEKKLAKEVEQARKKCDFLIVSFHWGKEFDFYPGEEQKTIAHLSIDSGADIVIGHHPHVLQGLEMYKGKPVFYSLGNFVFDNQIPEGTDQTLIVKLDIKNKRYNGLELTPVKIDNCRPGIAENDEAKTILERFVKYSKNMNANIKISGNKGFVK
jgi:gamma-polyglutamate biosynthesis protein CapA